MKSIRKCVVCGAHVKNMNPKTVTCDPVCTRARRAARTRQEQLEFENQADIPDPDGTGCPVCGCRWCICEER